MTKQQLKQRLKRDLKAVTRRILEVPYSPGPRLSVIIPYYRAGFIGWAPLESLVRQEGVEFQWELLIMEENFHNPFGFASVSKYWERLREAGCIRIKYMESPEWVPLSAKWYWLIQNTDPQSDVICCNAADIYMSRHRLARQFALLNQTTPWNWHKLSGNLVYDIASGEHVKYESVSKERHDTCCRAASSKLLRQLPLVHLRRGLDKWMYKGLLPQIHCYYDESDLWHETLNITGLNNISLGRGGRVRDIEPPLQDCCSDIQNHIPEEIAQKLVQSRKHVLEHIALLKKTNTGRREIPLRLRDLDYLD